MTKPLAHSDYPAFLADLKERTLLQQLVEVLLKKQDAESLAQPVRDLTREAEFAVG